MDALKLIPQVFFDAIGRVVPGAVALALALFWIPEASSAWQKLLQVAQGTTNPKETSTVFAALSLLLVAYALGHIISPLTKLIQRVGEWLAPRTKDETQTKKYDWLRVHSPEAGAHCAKLRAEFTLYNSLSAVFLLAVPVSTVASPPATLTAQGVLLILAAGMAYRGYEGADTFAKSVSSFHEVATERPLSSHTPFKIPKSNKGKASEA